MKITRIRVFQTGLPYVGGAYIWGAGNMIETAIASYQLAHEIILF